MIRLVFDSIFPEIIVNMFYAFSSCLRDKIKSDSPPDSFFGSDRFPLGNIRLCFQSRLVWLIFSFTQKSTSGFQSGVDDLRMLLGEAMKASPGYNFAFRLGDYRSLFLRHRHRLVLFKAPFVHIFWHYWYDKPQAIFWGPDATNMYEVLEEHGFYTVELEDEDGDLMEFETKSLEELIEIVERYEVESAFGFSWQQ